MQVVVVIGLAAVIGAPGPKETPKKEALSLFGEWIPESAVIGGKVDAPPPGAAVTLTKEGKFIVKEGKDESVEMTFTHDAKKDPPEMDITGPGGMGPGAMKGIYKLEGDVLMICLSVGGERPTTFASPAGTMTILLTLKKPKKD